MGDIGDYWREARDHREARRYARKACGASAHRCHWPSCNRVVPPRLWGCRKHWYRLPADLRARIWETYRPGQELTKTPSAEYREAAKAVQAWIAAQESTDGAAGEASK